MAISKVSINERIWSMIEDANDILAKMSKARALAMINQIAIVVRTLAILKGQCGQEVAAGENLTTIGEQDLKMVEESRVAVIDLRHKVGEDYINFLKEVVNTIIDKGLPLTYEAVKLLAQHHNLHC